MVRESNDALARSWVLFTSAACLVLALVPPLLAGTATEGGAAGVVVVVLAVGVLLASGRLPVLRAARVMVVRAGCPAEPHVRRGGDITDPPHHPVCPRAPGLR